MLKKVSFSLIIVIGLCVVFLFVFLSFIDKPKDITSTQPAFKMTSGKPVERGTKLIFPKDHGIHSEQGIEWWYLTANLQSDTGETFGVQWTLFRTLMPSHIKSQWWDNNLYFAHFAIQHKQEHISFERFSRAGQTKVTSFPFKASIDNWTLSSINTDFIPLKLTVEQEGYAVNLTLRDSPIVLHGDNGYSQKTQSGHASYYYSYPFLKVKGRLSFSGKEYNVIGNAWYDREWSASLLDKNQVGWDWFSLVETQLPKQGLMLFCIRGNEQYYDYCSGTSIDKNGKTTHIAKEKIKLSVLETVTLDGHIYPSKWQVELPDVPVVIIESITKDSRNKLTIPYWEGRVKVNGGFEGKGYAELTGY